MSIRDELDRVEDTHRDLHCITDLLTPGLDLNDEGKDRLAMLLGRLLREQEAAVEAIRAAVLEGKPS